MSGRASTGSRFLPGKPELPSLPSKSAQIIVLRAGQLYDGTSLTWRDTLAGSAEMCLPVADVSIARPYGGDRIIVGATHSERRSVVDVARIHRAVPPNEHPAPQVGTGCFDTIERLF